MKFLTVCEGGNVRSVGLGYVLKYHYGHDAIAFSFGMNGEKALELLAGWSDYIIVLQPKFAERFSKYADKLRCLDVGADRWGNPFHPELQGILQNAAREWAEKEWKL